MENVSNSKMDLLNVNANMVRILLFVSLCISISDKNIIQYQPTWVNDICVETISTDTV